LNGKKKYNYKIEFMKLTHILIIFLFSSFLINTSKAQQTLENAANKAADNIVSGIKSCKDIPRDSKIAVLFFESSDGSKTKLGAMLSKKIAAKVSLSFNKKEYDILFPENIEEKQIDKMSAKYFRPPSTQEEEEFYKNFNNSKRPDYFLIGKYYINPSFSKITITEISIQKNTYNLNDKKTSCGINNTSEILIENEDIETLRRLNLPITTETDFYMQLMNFNGNQTDFFDFNIYDIDAKKELNENSPMIINKFYSLSVHVKKPCYLYAFMYCPDDKENPFIQPLYPYNEEDSTLFQAGDYYLPTSGGFLLTPPASKVYFKIITVSAENLKIEMKTTKGIDGYITTVLDIYKSELLMLTLNQILKKRAPVEAKLKIYNANY